MWVVIPLILCGLIGIFVPAVSIWTAAGLLALVALFVIPITRKVLGPVLRVYPDRPVRGALKIAAIVLYSMALFGVGFASRQIHQEMEADAARRRAADAARVRVIAEANQKVTHLLDQADEALRRRDPKAAKSLLLSADQVPDAQSNSQVVALLERINLSSDKEAVRRRMLEMSDVEFKEFGSTGKVPPSLELGYDVLTKSVVALARAQLPSAVKDRAEQAKRAMAEAERQRQEALARAESERKAKEQKEAEERARSEAAQREVKDKLDAYLAVLKAADVSIVENVAVRRDADIWNATLTVSDIWHLKHKQIRLQDAQTLWKAWAAIASPRDPDKAFIRIVDHNDNEVGGSRVWGGSLIWVQD